MADNFEFSGSADLGPDRLAQAAVNSRNRRAGDFDDHIAFVQSSPVGRAASCDA